MKFITAISWLYCLIIIFVVISHTSGKLILKHYPTASELFVPSGIGKSIISCEIESDRPYTLRWYKNDVEIDYNFRPPWPYNYTGGMTLAQWPYMKNYSRGTYECRASNGHDPDVSYKVKFTPVFFKRLPAGFPTTLKSPPKQKNSEKRQYYGTNITLECDATNNPNIFWTFEYIPFEKIKFPPGEGFDYWFSPDKRTLKIYNLKKVTAKYITCFVANDVGMTGVNLEAFKLDTRPVPIPHKPPVIFEKPKNVSVAGPEQWIEFVCNATGYPPPYYIWKHDGRTIQYKTESAKISVVAMKTSELLCIAENEAGRQEAKAYLYVKPVPYKAHPPEPDLKGHTPTTLTIELKPYFEELNWHKDIPITYAILHTRPWHENIAPWDPYNKTRIPITGQPPWYYTFTGMEPFTWIDVRIAFGNRYGVGNFSDWKHGYSDFGEIKDPVRNLHAVAHSKKSFTMYWEDPIKTNGLLKRYTIYWTRIPTWPLEKWEKIHKVGQNWKTPIRHHSFNWTGDTYMTDSAPVIYWKIKLFGFVNAGPMSKTQAIRVCPGAPGYVTNVSAKTKDSRSILVYWNATKDVGNGIVSHQIMYYRQDVRSFEEDWYVLNVPGKNINEALITELSPNRPYLITVYPVSHAMKGVRSKIVNSTTLPDVPTAAPRNVHGEVKSSQTIEVYFEPPPEEHQNAPIISYQIYYTRKLSRKPLVITVGKDVRNYLLQGLAKYSKYIIWVIAVNTKGTSPPSPKFESYTEEDVPDGAPKSVRVQAINDTAISVIWLPPEAGHQNGRLMGFNVFYSNGQWTEKMQILGAQARSGIVHQYIAADSLYYIQVAAFTSSGDGPRSKQIPVQTLKKLPTSPKYLNASIDLIHNRVRLVWQAPVVQFTGFRLQWGKSLRKFDMLRDIKEKFYPSIVRQVHVEDLDPGVFYCFKVSADLSTGGSTASDLVWFETSPDVPTSPPQFFEAIPQSSSSIKLRWEEPLAWKRNGDIVAYVLRYRAVGEEKWRSEKYVVQNDEDTIVYLLTNLKANTRYQLKVRAGTVVGYGMETNVLEAKTIKEVLPMVTKLKALEIETHTVYLEWGESVNTEKFQNMVELYKITYTCMKSYTTTTGEEKDYRETKSFISSSRQYQLQNLQPGTSCYVGVQVELSEVGIGDPVNVTFTTLPKAPKEVVTPKLAKSYEKSRNVISMLISPSLEANGPVQYYQLFVVDIGDKDVIPSNLKAENFGVGQTSTRFRRSTTEQDWPYHVAGYFKSSELPLTYDIGDGTQDRNFDNKKLSYKHNYIMFTRAHVEMPDGSYLTSNSPVSKPIQFLYKWSDDTSGSNNNQKGTGDSGGGMVPIIAGAAGGLLCVIIAAIVIVIVCRRKSPKSSEEETLVRKKSKKRSKNNSDPTELHRQQKNTPGLMRHPPIPVETLPAHVENLKANDRAKFRMEFDSIDPGEKPTADCSLKETNKSKNRFPNVLAYDSTRVKLDFDGNLCSDYINANYIGGYCREKAYIATQGPMKNTVDDFWRLCWEQNVQTIVMMTRLKERGKNKCEQYWPSKGSETYGKIKVELKHEKQSCNYSIRSFVITDTTDTTATELNLKQFQYLHWPDPGVPTNPGPVLTFIRRVRDYNPPGSGPILVHCSAGVGRTACFIAIDAMIERVKQDSMIDIYGYVNMLRSQRNYMVQTDEQYLFIYEALSEYILYGNTEVASSDLTTYFKKLQELRTDEGVETLLEKEFRSIATAQSSIIDPAMVSVASSSLNESKNRSMTIVPYDVNRVPLQPLRSHEGSDYINASFIDGHETKGVFIASQGPMQNTVADFWRMVVEHECTTIVMLCNVEKNTTKEQCFEYWPTTKSMRHHYYVIDPVQEKRFAHFIVREFKITDARDSSTRHVRQYHYTLWPSSRIPPSSAGIIELVGQVQKAHKKDSGAGPIIVHGSTGSGRTGVFIGLCIALQSLRTERIVDIPQIVKALRHQRPFMVQTLEQYEYMYQVTCDFLKNFDFVV